MRDRATEAFDKVREAWDALETDEKRQKYIDHVILGKPTEEEEAMAQSRRSSMRRPTLRRGSRPSTQADSRCSA